MINKYKEDYFVMTQRKWTNIGGILRTIKHRNLRICFWGRIATTKSNVVSYIAKIMLKHYENRYGIELSLKNFFWGAIVTSI